MAPRDRSVSGRSCLVCESNGVASCLFDPYLYPLHTLPAHLPADGGEGVEVLDEAADDVDGYGTVRHRGDGVAVVEPAELAEGVGESPEPAALEPGVGEVAGDDLARRVLLADAQVAVEDEGDLAARVRRVVGLVALRQRRQHRGATLRRL